MAKLIHKEGSGQHQVNIILHNSYIVGALRPRAYKSHASHVGTATMDTLKRKRQAYLVQYNPTKSGLSVRLDSRSIL